MFPSGQPRNLAHGYQSIDVHFRTNISISKSRYNPSLPAADYWLFRHCSFVMEVELTLTGPSPKPIHPSGCGVRCGQALRSYAMLLHLLMNSRLPCMWLNSKQLPGLTPAVQIQDLCTSGTPTTHHEVNVQVKLSPGMSVFSLSSKEAGAWSSQSSHTLHTEGLHKSGNLSSRQHTRVHPNVFA